MSPCSSAEPRSLRTSTSWQPAVSEATTLTQKRTTGSISGSSGSVESEDSSDADGEARPPKSAAARGGVRGLALEQLKQLPCTMNSARSSSSAAATACTSTDAGVGRARHPRHRTRAAGRAVKRTSCCRNLAPTSVGHKAPPLAGGDSALSFPVATAVVSAGSGVTFVETARQLPTNCVSCRSWLNTCPDLLVFRQRWLALPVAM
mmetsp:Transcript_15210/g.40131  ORF Transcript_15210/g.40131 Transcript_15210/m.40131 type:complete len:205 (-) Transcript_15210:319-933(-)